MSSQSRIKQINLKLRTPPKVQVEIINPFKPLCNLFKREDPFQKSKNRVIELQNQIRTEEARQLYLSGQNDPKIKKFILQNYRTYLKMEYAPSIPVACPHCNSNIILSPICSQCGWALGVHFSDMVNQGFLLATPTIKAPLRKGERLICINRIAYNKNQMVTLYQSEQDGYQKTQNKYHNKYLKNFPSENGQMIRFYHKSLPQKDYSPKDKVRQRPQRPSVDSDVSGFIHPRKIHRSVSDVVKSIKQKPTTQPQVLNPDRVVKMQNEQ
jgi:hypothetical protein